MDPLSEFTALSPSTNEVNRPVQRDPSNEMTSQQCSADPMAFTNLQRRVVMNSKHSPNGMRLELELGTNGDELSQLGMSQPPSQMNDLFNTQTQQEEDDMVSGAWNFDPKTLKQETAEAITIVEERTNMSFQSPKHFDTSASNIEDEEHTKTNATCGQVTFNANEPVVSRYAVSDNESDMDDELDIEQTAQFDVMLDFPNANMDQIPRTSLHRQDSEESYAETESLGDDGEAMDDDYDEKQEQLISTSIHDATEYDDDDGELAETQVADKPISSPYMDILPDSSSWNKTALKKREKILMQSIESTVKEEYELDEDSCNCDREPCQCAKSASKATASSAIRNLRFEFAVPQSQDSELHEETSVPLETARAMNLSRDQGQDKFTFSHSTPPKLSPAESITPKKRHPEEITMDTSPMLRTPNNRKRGRVLPSPDVGLSQTSIRSGTPQRTPTVKRLSMSSSSSTPVPNIRTRPKMLSPIPASRTYPSRSNSIFKDKYEFCLTGFLKQGLSSLIELIEGHGGTVGNADILQKTNSKAVVIATPISWRKLKFMHAIACGIPVVHPEWIHACIRAGPGGRSIPFDGYCVPSGYSITTRKFECLPVQKLEIFRGYTFGIAHDVEHSSVAQTRDMSGMITFILRSCGADDVIEVPKAIC